MPRLRSRRWWAATVTMFLTLAGLVTMPTVASAAPGTGSVTLNVVSARDSGDVHEGDAVTAYKWMITADDVGDPHDAMANCLPPRAGGNIADFAAAGKCKWPSVRYTPGAVPVIAQGDDSTLSGGTALDGLDPGNYLISVTADGFKIDGEHFTVTDGGTAHVTVSMQPYPLPLGTVRLRVFNDSVPVDGTYEVGAESGLAGFTAHLSDVMGEVSTDYYGNPLCTTYVHDSQGRMVFVDDKPQIAAGSIGKCVSDANGDVVIPNLGPDRYAATVIPPTGTNWVQTTTLEGGHDWDIWTQEGDTGFDTEQTIGGEPVPAVDFGFVAPKALGGSATGEVTGTIVQARTYVGGQGGVTLPNAGVAGASIAGPVSRPWLALSDLNNGDQMVYLAQGGADGKFDIRNVPDGDYQLTAWDGPQELILDFFNVTISGGKAVDIGAKPLVGWFTEFSGSVFIDANANGKRDAGEVGVPGFPVALKERDNSVMDQGINTVTTDRNGNYDIRQAYPMGKWLVLEAFNTRYTTTGITYQADNQPTPTTMLGAAVDVNVLPVIGLSGKVDWGVQAYKGAESGGIAGTVTYDTTRNELDPRYAATEPYQPGIPDIEVHLFAVARDDNGNPIKNPDGSYKFGPELNDAYTAETWDTSKNCVPRLFNGDPLTDQLALPDTGADPANTCVESPMDGVQIIPSDTTPGNFGQTVNGNYAFADSKLNLYPVGDPNNPGDGDPTNGDNDLPLYAPLPDGVTQPLLPDDYLVQVVSPDNPVGGGAMYKPTREEDVNIFNGDEYVPQEGYVNSGSTDGGTPPGDQPTPDSEPSQGNGFNPECAGANHPVHVTDQAFLDGGGSPFEGQARPLCDVKLVTTRGGQAVAPNFNMFTDVPLPAHFWGLTINDLGLSHDKRSINYGEAEPLANVPVGIYDYAGRLVDTVDTDFNGFYEAIEPSTSTYNCPLPAGPCPNMYRFVGNDPGQPGHLNPNYNRRFRTIATNFQAWPGLYTTTDTAPTQVGVVAVAPGSTQINPVNCAAATNVPQLFSVSKPLMHSDDTNRQVTILGQGFGASQGAGRVSLSRVSNGTPQPLTVNSWSDTRIVITIGATAFNAPANLEIVADNGQKTVNGLTFQMIGSFASAGNNTGSPRVRNVNYTGTLPFKELNYTSVQEALEAAAASNQPSLVVVWPHAAETNNPAGAYYENIVIHSPVRLQGVGPGGQYPDRTYVPGSVLDGLGFNVDNDRGTAWVNLVGSLTHTGPDTVPDGAVVTVLPRTTNQFNSGNPTTIDGFTITGGTQADFATNINDVTGGTTTPYGAPGAVITQGGGVYLHADANYTSVSDNVIIGNSGSYGGGVRVGTPYVDTSNDNVSISHNRIRDNGGTNLAGGVGIFAGSDNYSVDHNDLCGNFSAEYGGAVSHFGRSNNGTINHNRIWLNQSYDEAGGVMVAGQLPADPNQLSPGSGPATIDANVIQDNLANDDGGGIRLLQAGNFPINITNNMVVNNISAHEGGGIALDDAPDVRLVNDTVIGNLTTATAVTSNGQPAPAGLSTTANSDQLQATLPSSAPTFSNPKMFNDIFWDNRAGNWNGQNVLGIGAGVTGDIPIRHWDVGVADSTSDQLSPLYSMLQVATGTVASPTNQIGVDPHVVSQFATSVIIETSRTFPTFRQAVIVVQPVPGTQMGNYHLAAGSPAINAGTPSVTYSGVTITDPSLDIDDQVRPNSSKLQPRRPDTGADEYY
jgi:hypothetical protein